MRAHGPRPYLLLMPNPTTADRSPLPERARFRLAAIALVATTIIGAGALLTATNHGPDATPSQATNRPPSGTQVPTN